MLLIANDVTKITWVKISRLHFMDNEYKTLVQGSCYLVDTQNKHNRLLLYAIRILVYAINCKRCNENHIGQTNHA